MVCDLQGICRDDVSPTIFELTDPVVHYASKKTMVYGRADKGSKGMDLLFKTHRCSNVCRLMELSKNNRNWRKQWHEGDWLKKATTRSPVHR